jgi:hypothetical protein
MLSTCAATMLIATFAAWGQSAAPPRSAITPPPPPPNVREVFLIRQDQSDCTNTTVPGGDSPNVEGTLSLSRGNDGNTTVKLAMTVSPNTTYHFYLKCVRELGTITTGDEGTGFATFVFPTNSTGATYAFDMYPAGAPLGNKFQSATVNY